MSTHHTLKTRGAGRLCYHLLPVFVLSYANQLLAVALQYIWQTDMPGISFFSSNLQIGIFPNMLAVTIPLHILYCTLEYTAEYHEWTFDGRSVWCSEQMSGAAFHPPQHMQYVLIQSCYAVYVNIIRRRYDSNITRGPLVSTSSICMIMAHVLRTTASLWEAFLSFLKQQWDRRCSRPLSSSPLHRLFN